MIANTAHPSEILLFVTSSTGFILTFLSWRTFHRHVQDIRIREINGLVSILAYGHERDERIRMFIMGLMMLTSILFMMAPQLTPMPRELVLGRAILNAVSILITLKSYFNMRDREKIMRIQAHRQQRAGDGPRKR